MTWIPNDLPPERGVFCNRTLNLRSIRSIGYDMDYTLIHYHVDAWEGSAFEHLKQGLLEKGWPVEDVVFEPEMVARGLVIDRDLGNLIKVNRFGYVKQAAHGRTFYGFDQLRRTYRRTLVDLGESRYQFLNTLFSISEACMYMQLVELLDEHKLPGVMNYADLSNVVRLTLDQAHMEGELKREIIEDPGRFVDLDPNIPRALLDQKEAGKRLLLITNSGWNYTKAMMNYAFNPYLPDDLTWRDLFEVVIVSARKPAFFSERAPLFRIINEEGELRPCLGGPTEPGLYLGGHAGLIEEYLQLNGDRLLYVGDHVFSDVRVSKSVQRWRTALVIRELEEEIVALQKARGLQDSIATLMHRKETLEYRQSQAKLALLREEKGHDLDGLPDFSQPLKDEVDQLNETLRELDTEIGKLVVQDGNLFNEHWGYLMWSGNDTSHLMDQISKSADIYTSRVSNLLPYTPFAYFRSPRGASPHELSQIYKMPPAIECE